MATNYYLVSIGYRDKKRKSETNKNLDGLAKKLGAEKYDKKEKEDFITKYNLLNSKGHVIPKNNHLAIFSDKNSAPIFLGKALDLNNTKYGCIYIVD